MLMVELTIGRERIASVPAVWEEILKGSGVKGGVGESGGEATAVPHHVGEWVRLVGLAGQARRIGHDGRNDFVGDRQRRPQFESAQARTGRIGETLHQAVGGDGGPGAGVRRAKDVSGGGHRRLQAVRSLARSVLGGGSSTRAAARADSRAIEARRRFAIGLHANCPSTTLEGADGAIVRSLR